MSRPTVTRGMTLVELLIATAIGVALLLGTTQVVLVATQAQVPLADALEQQYQGQFALERIEMAASQSVTQGLEAAAVNESGLWLAPVRFCINQSAQLVETFMEDLGCDGGDVVSEGVTQFEVGAKPSTNPLAAVTLRVSITLNGGRNSSLSLTRDFPQRRGVQ